MSSIKEDKALTTLYGMIKELQYHRRDRGELFSTAVKERLNESFKSYYDSIMRTYDRLENENELRLMRKLNRL